jgi:hypothetical protein
LTVRVEANNFERRLDSSLCARPLTSHVENRKWSPATIHGRPTYYRKPNRLVEANGRVILLVDLDLESAVSDEALGVRDEQLSSTPTMVGGVQKQRLDGAGRDTEKADHRVPEREKDPPLERVAGELLRDKGAECQHIGVAEEVMGSANRAFPQLEQLVSIFSPCRPDVHIHGW